jgi:hypothetical protein
MNKKHLNKIGRALAITALESALDIIKGNGGTPKTRKSKPKNKKGSDEAH